MNLEHIYAAASERVIPLHVVQRQHLHAWLQQQTADVQAWLHAQAFTAAAGSAVLVPGSDGIAAAVIGIADPLDAYSYAHAPFALPVGDYGLVERAPPESTPPESTPSETTLDAAARAALQLGWGLGCYRFDRYKKPLRKPARLVLDNADDEAHDLLTASLRVRDWVNTPTQDMGPQQLEDATRELASAHGAEINVISGDALLDHNFPTIHAVGRASHRAPRLIELHWGDAAHPQLAVVGKGVCFDTGGLDIKPADGMRNMKKDMGGAAHALALAGLIMARKLPVRLRLLLPAVENSIGPEAFRPGEVITTRQGVSVEIDNTDAEGRLILCDALTYAGEASPDLLLDFATLTGAARIALGPDLPALFCNDDALAQAWLDAGQQQRDPVWRLPLWRPYLRYLTSNIADMANAGSRMAGSVTAALYLERFVPANQPWAHLDVYAWNDSERPGRPTGGEALGLRSAWAMLKARYG